MQILLDYPSYSIAIGKIKAAYQIGYSIFDKIAHYRARAFLVGAL